MRISPENIKSLKPNQIFVFGSNCAGRHGAGAAKTAMQWGAIIGRPEGLQGQTYAIPTKDKSIYRTLYIDEIKPYVDRFIAFAQNHPEYEFLVTPIGTGLAGINPKDIAPLFKNALTLINVWLPKIFLENI